jgi:hypothetical protein
MARKVLIVALVAVLLVGAIGCMAHTHTVGAGSRGMGPPTTAKQWYILWGLVPINSADSKYLAGDATDYTVHTWQSPIDVIINIFLGYYTSIKVRTVEVWR